MALVECVKKSVVQSVGNITMYVNMNLANFRPVLSSSLTNPYKVKGIEPETDYYLFTVGIDANGAVSYTHLAVLGHGAADFVVARLLETHGGVDLHLAALRPGCLLYTSSS